MTDNEIIKALECCLTVPVGGCNKVKCPMITECLIDRKALEKHALSLINRQKAEIERLLKEKYPYIGDVLTETKAEAIKEFAERLKKALLEEDGYYCDIFNEIEFCEAINNLVKEMTEDQNDV